MLSCIHYPDNADVWTGQPAAVFKLVQPTCRHGLTITGAGAIVALNAGYAAVIGIAVCWLGLFLPGILMIYAVLPWWGAFRNVAVYRRCGPRSILKSVVKLDIFDLKWCLTLRCACVRAALMSALSTSRLTKGCSVCQAQGGL